MKRLFHKILLFLSFSLFFSCKKSINEDASAERVDLISQYQKEYLRTANQRTIDYTNELFQRADLSSIITVNYYNTSVLVAPLNRVVSAHIDQETNQVLSEKKDFLTRKFSKKYEFLLFYVNEKKVHESRYVLVSTNESFKTVERDLENITKYKPTIESEITYRNINSKYYYTVALINNNLLLFNTKKEVTNKTSNNKIENNSISSNGCTAWYLITTIYFSDGTVEEYSQYLTTTCDNSDCSVDPFYQQLQAANCENNAGGPPSLITPQKRLCGTYNWLNTGASGGAKNAVISGLYATFSPNNNPSIRLNAVFPDACITIPNHCSTNSNTLSTMFNDAFNRAVAKVENGLSTNTIPPGDFLVTQALKREIQAELSLECAGSVFNNGGCSFGVPRNSPQFCS